MNGQSHQLLLFLGKKFRDVLFTLVLMSLLVFAIFHVIPGDPVAMILGTDAPPEKRAALEEQLQLDRPAHQRYISSLTGLFDRENPSKSIRFQKPVRDLIREPFKVTLNLALLSFFLILLAAVPLAIICAVREGKWADRIIGAVSQLFMAIPPFFLGILLILLLSLALRSFQTVKYVPLAGGFWRSQLSLLLPAVAIALPKLSQVIQFLRSELVLGKREDYVRTAKSKGAGPARILFLHLMRNSLLPLVTTLALVLADLFTGSLIVEQVFLLPGISRLLIAAIEARDLPLAQGIVMLIALLVILVNLAGDLGARLIDPRLDSADATGGKGGSLG